MSTYFSPRNSSKAENREVLAVYPSEIIEDITVKLIKLKYLDVSQATRFAMPRTSRRVTFYGTGSDGRSLFTINLDKLSRRYPFFNPKRSIGVINSLYYMDPRPVRLEEKD